MPQRRPQAPNGRSGPQVAVGYLRRSTDRQEQSIPDQRKAIERYAAEHDLELARYFVDDAISGTSAVRRPAFQEGASGFRVVTGPDGPKNAGPHRLPCAPHENVYPVAFVEHAPDRPSPTPASAGGAGHERPFQVARPPQSRAARAAVESHGGAARSG
ncbi:MAG: recombinase family protein [Planctomycetes bacterium]|nr:recombinase family protein [Planctomycetota bacterium]